ncbi:unnamed protein product [Paramecium sonneborni]|uniref:Uncharacterized protein n=1 Tax=Paramecium sonneborni TaxID=65129 RepID=A0A8S1QRE2_9CILI|nr:unnamed protein product [Paramecium sonneborni]
MQQSESNYQQTLINCQNQNQIFETQLNEIKQTIDSSQNQQLKLPNINLQNSRTEYQYNQDPNKQNINDLIEMHKNNSLPLLHQTYDEVLDQDQNTVMILKLNNIIYFNPMTIFIPYQTKWITQESLQISDFFYKNQQQVYIDQNIQDLPYKINDQINVYVNYYNIKIKLSILQLYKSIQNIQIIVQQKYQQQKKVKQIFIVNYLKELENFIQDYQFYLVVFYNQKFLNHKKNMIVLRIVQIFYLVYSQKKIENFKFQLVLHFRRCNKRNI